MDMGLVVVGLPQTFLCKGLCVPVWLVSFGVPRASFRFLLEAHPDLQAQNLGAVFEEILDGHSGMPRDLVKLGTVGQDHVPGRERLK